MDVAGAIAAGAGVVVAAAVVATGLVAVEVAAAAGGAGEAVVAEVGTGVEGVDIDSRKRALLGTVTAALPLRFVRSSLPSLECRDKAISKAPLFRNTIVSMLSHFHPVSP